MMPGNPRISQPKKKKKSKSIVNGYKVIPDELFN